MVNKELAHYGILGMKWGIRRTPARLARARGSKKTVEDVHDDYKRAQDKKSVKSMSDKELRERNNRLQMEAQYATLTKKKTSAGKKFVTGLVATAVTGVASSYVNKYARVGADYVEKSLSKGVENFVLNDLKKGFNK